MHQPIRVLFVCDGNAGRAQMAAGLLRVQGGARFAAHSAAIEPRPLEPLAVAVLQEVGIDIGEQPAKSLNDYEDLQFDYVVTLYEDEQPTCLDFSRDGHALYWRCPDPSEVAGPEAERLAAFRQARDALKVQVEAWCAALPG